MFETESQLCAIHIMVASLLVKITRSAAFKVVSIIPRQLEGSDRAIVFMPARIGSASWI